MDWLDAILEWFGDHQVIAVILFLLLMLGGCSIVMHVSVSIDSSPSSLSPQETK